MKVIARYLVASLTLTSLLAAGERPAENSYVACAVSIKQNSLRAGAAGKISILLTPRRGIHINLVPPVQVKFDSSDAVDSFGAPEIPKRDTTLNTSKPIVVPVTLRKTAKAGSLTLKGSVTYFYCSETEGWCSKFKQPVEFTVKIVR